MRKLHGLFGIFAAAVVLALPIVIGTSLVVTTGCVGPVSVGQDEFVVRAEQVEASTFHTIDAFLRFEKNNRDVLWSIDHGIKKMADDIRALYPPARASLQNAIATYKRTRSEVNRDAISAALAVVEDMKAEAVKWHAISVNKKG